jgi:uncharacterized spore protein YtfJ
VAPLVLSGENGRSGRIGQIAHEGAAGMENVQTILAQARDAMTVKRVFGDPIERDGVTVIPVAHVMGGGGGGGGASLGRQGEETEQRERETGAGAGFGVSSSPAGVFVIKNGNVSWQPAVNANRIVMGGQVVGALALLIIYLLLRARRR